MHSVVFKNCENSWQNALPIGNGVFGGMAYYKNRQLALPLNHYEVYYNIKAAVLPEDILAKTPLDKDPGGLRRSYEARAERNQPQEGESFTYFRLDKAAERPYHAKVADTGESYPQTGELHFHFAEAATEGDSLLRLDVERGLVTLALDGISTEIFAARRDAIVTEVTGAEMLLSIDFGITEQRDRDMPSVTYRRIDDHTFAYTVSDLLSGERPFTFSTIVRLVGATGTLEGGRITLCEREDEIKIITGVFTEWRYADPLADGIKEIERIAGDFAAVKAEHRAYWREFFERAAISLPDKFLEKAYYINQYALDCSSGKGGVMKHHACGLNGLWDIKHPNIWGSKWYWDVNIQAAFAGVFSSNRLDLGRVFADGLLSYVELAERFARNYHGFDGVALDYPYPFYFCIWPWCAQYLWSQYEYSLDTDFLRDEAYPLFLKLCRFALAMFKYDEKRGEYVVYPDISPEQGPLAHNTVSTVASVKHMLHFTLKAADILGDTDPLLPDIRNLLAGLPAYPTATDDYGERWLDSEDAPKDMWIRHPSMLMPVFPTGEIHIESDARQRAIAMNTVRFLETHCEIGVFQVSWLAAVAARMGEGQTALRLLYEMGLDHLLRSNGLAAEANERFMNSSLIIRQPLYYPCMMEFTGEMLAAVNEMLLQSDGGCVRLFPAMPNGDPENSRMWERGYAQHEYPDRFNEYPAWESARFDRLLARGAFEVSAELKDGRIAFVKVKSHKGGSIRITSPYSLAHFGADENNTLHITMKPNEECVLGTYTARAEADEGGIDTHLAYTKRHIYIGEDSDTAYQRALDSFTRDWFLGNVRMENHSVYKFDLGLSYQKDYRGEFPRQCFGAEKKLPAAMNFRRLDALPYTVKRGYGLAHADGVSAVDRGAPDLLRRDLLEGSEPNEFLIEAPAGQYELFVVSGDAEEASVTVLDCDEGRRTGGEVIKAGSFQYKLLPIVHEEDGLIRLRISTRDGFKWKLNYLLVNLYKQF